MEKEQIFSNLKAKIGQTSLSERTINDYIERMKPSEGDPDDAWFNTHSEILKSLSGNFSADVANQVNEFKKNYKPEPDNQNQNQNQNQNPPAPQPNAEIEALKQQLKQMQEQMTGMQNKTALDLIRNSVLSKADSLSANAGLWKLAVEQTKLEGGITEDQYLANVKTSYEALNKNVFGANASPYGNSGNNGGTGKQEIDDYFKNKGGVWGEQK